MQRANQNLQDFGGDVYDVYAGAKKSVSDVGSKAYNSFGKFATEVDAISQERNATKYGISQEDIDFVVDDLIKQGYKDEDIIASIQAFDAEEKARKQQEWAQKQQSNYENASL